MSSEQLKQELERHTVWNILELFLLEVDNDYNEVDKAYNPFDL